MRVEHRVHGAAAVMKWLAGWPAGGQVPDRDGPVGAAGGDEMVVAGEHRELACGRPGQGALHLAGGQVVDGDGAVLAGDREQVADAVQVRQ